MLTKIQTTSNFLVVADSMRSDARLDRDVEPRAARLDPHPEHDRDERGSQPSIWRKIRKKIRKNRWIYAKMYAKTEN